MIRQSLDCQLIPFLLKILDSRIEAENPSMVKAQIVSALKAMTHNLNYGDKVTHLLNSNPIWAEFRDQKHDLFITDTNVRGYLTGETLSRCGDFSTVRQLYYVTTNPCPPFRSHS